MQKSPTRYDRGSSTFKVALGVFVLLGFVQLMAVGVALTQRAGEERVVVKYESSSPIVLRELVEVAKLPQVAPKASISVEEIVNRFHPNGLANAGVQDVDTGMVSGGVVDLTVGRASYVVRHPLVAKLLEEAKQAYVQGDMGVAAMKAEEAYGLDSMEPAAADQLARIAEDMGALQRAKELYMKVFQMGYEAGPFYKRAALKIQNGVGKQMVEGCKMMLGGVNIQRYEDAKGAKVTIPIQSKKGSDVIADLVEVQVHFYDRDKGGKIVEASTNAEMKSLWREKEVDWNLRGEEVLDVSYAVAKVDVVQQQLFGQRKYYGQVVELYYKGVLQDVVAHPSTLHKVHAERNQGNFGLLPPVEPLENFNQDNPLLPSFPQEPSEELPQ